MLVHGGPNDVVLSSGFVLYLMAHGHPNGVRSAFEHAFGFVDPFLSFYSLVFVGGKVDAVFCSVDPEIPQVQSLLVHHM